jgi:nitroimidazol reductase NimA-like FMN-containing flavoprotein (pyridoxamine 5'-phosphate oxidase superfamily)
MMVKHLREGHEAAVAITHLDALVLARSGFETSINYRSVICFGTPDLVTDEDEFERQMIVFFEKLAPGRWPKLRPMKKKEKKATSMLVMEIKEASAKISEGGPEDEGDDLSWPIWAGHVPIKMSVGEAIQAEDSHDSEIEDVMKEFFKG